MDITLADVLIVICSVTQWEFNMTLGEWIKSIFKPKVATPLEPPKLSDKDYATLHNEPWVKVTSFDLDVDRLGDGSFSLDWNDIFVARLIKAGYRGKTDADVVDLWFSDICKNVVLETFQQNQADPSNRDRATL